MFKKNTKLWALLLLVLLSLIGAATSFAADQNVYFRGITPLAAFETSETETSKPSGAEAYTEATPAFAKEIKEKETYENEQQPSKLLQQQKKSPCPPGKLPVIKQGKVTGCTK